MRNDDSLVDKLSDSLPEEGAFRYLALRMLKGKREMEDQADEEQAKAQVAEMLSDLPALTITFPPLPSPPIPFSHLPSLSIPSSHLQVAEMLADIEGVEEGGWSKHIVNIVCDNSPAENACLAHIFEDTADQVKLPSAPLPFSHLPSPPICSPLPALTFSHLLPPFPSPTSRSAASSRGPFLRRPTPRRSSRCSTARTTGALARRLTPHAPHTSRHLAPRLSPHLAPRLSPHFEHLASSASPPRLALAGTPRS